MKDEDSYIYLNSIKGIAALSQVYPDKVLNILCEEYSDFNKNKEEGGIELRMKFGEILVQVIKKLGKFI